MPVHWRDKLGGMRDETWKEAALERARLEKMEYPRDSFEHHPQWRDTQIRTKRELRCLQDENRRLKDQKFQLQVQLKRKRPTATPDKHAVTETDGLFGKSEKSEKEWKKEYDRLEDIARVRLQDESLWRREEPVILREIAQLKAKNEVLRAEIQGLEDELERLTAMSTSLYFHRPEHRHTLGALGWRAALVWRL